MRIPFRQGLVRVPANFLQLAAGKVSLVLGSTDSVVATFADGAANYLITDRLTVNNAWIGPFSAGNDYWLYIDINPVTGARTFGHTVVSPLDGATAPQAPVLLDQHWFDTATNTHKVWNGNGWSKKIRVFVAKLQQGSVFVSMSTNSPAYTGTQVGALVAQPVLAGAIVFDADGNPLKKSDGTFFTTEDTALTGIASSSQVKFGSIMIEAEAVTNLPAFSIVRFSDFNLITAATNYIVDNGAYGIIERDAATGDVVEVVMEGLITNPAWDWTAAGINAQLFVDALGQLTTTPPPSPIPVAAVVDKHTILLRPSTLFMNTYNDPATALNAGNVKLSVMPASLDNPIAVGDNDPRITAVLPHIADYTVHLSTAQNTYLDTLAATAGGISVRKADNTGTSVAIVAPASGITVTNGDGTTGNPTIGLANDLAAVEGLTTTGITIRTGADAWTTRQVVVAADSSAGLAITNGDGVLNNPAVGVIGNLKEVQDITTAGLTVRSGTGDWSTVAIVANTTPGLDITNGDGVAGNPTISFSGDLASLTSQAGTGLAARTAAGTWTTRTLQSGSSSLQVTNGDGVAGNPTVSFIGEIGAVGGVTNTGIAVRKGVDDWDATSVAGVAGDIVVTNPSGFIPGPTPTTAAITLALQNVGTPVTDSFKRFSTDAKGRVTATYDVVFDDITASLGYEPLDIAGSNTMQAELDMGNFKIINTALPTGATDVATKGYVDSVASGLDPKESVRAATVGTITMSGAFTIDGVSLAFGDRVLVKNQADPTTNGIYVVAAGVWSRAIDAVPGGTMNAGAFTFVEAGTTNAKTGWVMSAQNPVVNGSTAITWQQFSGAGEITAGPGLAINGNTMSVVPSASNTLTITNSNIDLTVMPTVTAGATYKSVTVDGFGRVTAGTNPTTLGGYGITDAQPLNSNLTNLAAMSTFGILSRTGANTFTTRTIVGTSNQVILSIGDGTTGNPTIGLASDAVLPGNQAVTIPVGTTAQAPAATFGQLRYDSTTGMMRMTEQSSWRNVGTLRTLTFTAPALGFTVTQTNPTTDSANITFALNGELAGLQGMSTFGLSARTNTGTWTTRSLQGNAGRIVITNGSGVTGDPTLDLASNIVTTGTYRSVTVDTYGRVTSGTNPTTLSGYGITDAQPLNTNLTNVSAYNTNGFVVQNATGSFVGRSWSVNANSTANLAIANGDGVGGNPSIALAGDILAISQLNAVGFAVRTGAQTWIQRQLTGAANRISVTNATGVASDPVIDISASYVGQTSITTVGTINSGTWNGTTVAPQYGGTGLNTLGGSNTLFGINSAGSAGEYKTINGTANQITVAHGAGTITMSTPQDIGTSSNVQFNRVTAKQAVTTVQTLTDGATVTIDLANGLHATLIGGATGGASRQLANPSNMVAGVEVLIKYQPDATNRELTFGTAYKFENGTAPTFAAQTANKVNILKFWCDGTYMYEISRSLNM